MLSDHFKRIITPPARTLNIIWLAFMSAPFLYAGVAWFVTTGAEPKEADTGTLRLGLGVLAVVSVVASYLYRKRALGEAAIDRRLAEPPVNALPGSDDLEPIEQRLAGIFPYYQTTTIIILALRESVAVLGLILTILTGDFWQYVPFGLAAAAIIASQPPSVGSFMARVLPLALSTG